MKKTRLFLCVLLAAAISVYASGGKETQEKDVSQKNSWQERFDINGKKAGKYNIVVTAEDSGGNTALAGPMNIFIDPDSDLPVTGITNPLKDMCVPGNLNIVGTCVDDDAVDHVEIILDGNTEAPVVAEGTEFWSYYLDTTQLPDGPHTISVYGIDINGVKGKEQSVVWHLDRRSPATGVTNRGMGDLVSGKVSFRGEIRDGNGIKSLSYSLDGGTVFAPVPIKENRSKESPADTWWSFDLPVETNRLQDGPAVFWFKAVDGQGIQGLYSYLCFIDNTKPDVKIVSPAATQEVNGKFSVAGYAKDIIGLKQLTWSFAGESGSFELVPGNPFWSVDFDVRGKNVKSEELIISAEDTVGNSTVLKQKILINAAADMATVTVVKPQPGEIVYDEVLFEGFATDDDGIAKMTYTVDGGTPVEFACNGVFAENIAARAGVQLAAGSHTVKIWATDIDEVAGNIATVVFTVAGDKPAFGDVAVSLPAEKNAAPENRAYRAGMEVHPESGAEIKTDIESACGITELAYRFSGQEDTVSPFKTPVKGSVPFAVPVRNAPWGWTELILTASDVYGRKTEKRLQLYVTDLTTTRGDPQVVFAGSAVSENGIVRLDAFQAVSGYFVGGEAASAVLEPDTGFAAVRLEGNSIFIEQKNGTGTSDPVRVAVTTEKGIVYRSQELILQTAVEPPAVHLDTTGVQNGFEEVRISGSVQYHAPAAGLAYRIIRGTATEAGTAQTAMDEWSAFSADADGSFELRLESRLFGTGVFAVEIRAADSENGTGSAAVFVNAVPEPVPGADGKMPSLGRPVFFWAEGENLYYLVSYGAALSVQSVTAAGNAVADGVFGQGGTISRAQLAAGNSPVEVILADAAGKTYTGRYTVKKDGSTAVRLERINGTPYRAGMEVALPEAADQKTKNPVVLTVAIESDFPVSAVSWSCGGGAETKSPAKKTDGNRYEADILLANLAADITEIAVTAESSGGTSGSVSGFISVVREKPAAEIRNTEQVYWETLPETDSTGTAYYDIDRTGAVTGYANVKLPLTVALEKPAAGLSVQADGRCITVRADREGIFDQAVVVVTDAEGQQYRAAPVSVRCDFAAPELIWTEPENAVWAQYSVTVSGTVQETGTIASAAYSIDGGSVWNDLTFTAAADAAGVRPFKNTADIQNVPDGLVEILVRVTDTSGKKTVAVKTVHKDTQPPEVSVVVPEAGTAVNGETLVVFAVHDNGILAAREYIRAVPAQTEKNTGAAAPVEEIRSGMENRPLPAVMVGVADRPLAQDMLCAFTDEAGNEIRVQTWDFTVDAESDKPVAEIHVPADMEIIQTDFVISGVVYDDDGAANIWYKIDDGEFRSLDGYGTSFSIPVPLSSMTDNEHTVTVFAEDIHGIKGDETVRAFRISLEEPKGAVQLPTIDQTVKDRVKISGVSSDKNGIEKVQVSIDNGNTYTDVVGTETWEYEFDSHIIQDGTHVVFLKVWDSYGIEGLYSSLINVDNTAPEIRLELPLDDSKTTGMLFFSGQTTDNIGLSRLYLTVRSLDGQKDIPADLALQNLEPSQIITKGIDISALPNGAYNIEVSGEDAGGNTTRVSRNISLNKDQETAKITVLYPLSGEHVQGAFNIYGTAVAETPYSMLFLYIDGKEYGTAQVTESGYYKFPIEAGQLENGAHSVYVRGVYGEGKQISSIEQGLSYTAEGPWVTIDNFTMGDFAVDRPYIIGKAGYALTAEDTEALRSKETLKEDKEAILAKTVDKIEISFDNGKSFEKVGNTKEWKYRVENSDIPEGYHFMIVRALMKNGERAVSRTIIQVDKTAPYIKLISPGEGGRFNESIEFSGLSSDDVALKRVTLALRSGDKAAYEVPAFIQGLYFDAHFWGATMYDVGLGLTFFDDNVKLQFQFGQMSDSQFKTFRELFGLNADMTMRYGGNVMGAKLLANIGHVPFRYFLGPDWEWLSASFALGANFSSFSETQSGKSQILSAVLAQIEFPRITLPKRKMFRTFSVYTEVQVWFIPTDIESAVDIESVVTQVSGGIRLNLF